jgi:formate C-acetyltransferase
MINVFQFAPVTERIARIREKRDAFTQGKLITINTERTKIYTDYYREHPAEHPLLKRSGALLEWAKRKEVNVFDDDIFVGTPGPDERSMSVFVDGSPDWIKGIVDEETFKEAWQSGGAISMSDEQRDILIDAYEVWKDCSISKVFEGVMTDDMWDGFGNGSVIMGKGKYDEGYTGVFAGIQGHYIGNFDKVTNVGFGEVRRQALELIAAHKGKIFGDWAKKQVFYTAVVRVCDAAILLSKRYAAACRVKAGFVAEPERRAELLRMADSLDWIMENPARTYWEGLQAHVFYELMLQADCQQHGQSMGRVDKHVGHLLEKEFEAGAITEELAQEYSDAFVLRLCDIIVVHGGMLNNRRVIELNAAGMNAYMAIYSAMTATGGIVLTLGGCKPDGTDDSNRATYCLLQTYGRMHLTDPTVGLRIHKNTPDAIWRLGIESSKICGGMPQFQNDEVIIPALIKVGFSVEDAYNYGIVGCVEPGGDGNEWSASGNNGGESVWNLMEVMQLVINGGVNPRTGKTAVPCKKLYEYESFEELQETFVKQMQHCLDWSTTYVSMYELAYSQNFPCIVASSMMDGCLESGKDATEGGAKYNRTGLTGCGTANIGDSLMAIKKLCFDDKTVTLRELYDALQADWVGYEQLRQTIINDVPHYGNDIEEVDELAAWGLGTFAEIMKTEQGPRGYYSGGTFTVTAHVFLGSMIGATPDGRKAGDPIADAISSRQGFDKNGPTSYLRSAAKLPHEELANGDQLNIRFTPSAVSGDEGALKLQNLMKTYFRLGGMQVQFNVVGTQKLRAAQENPLEYKDLVVRIAGFSTYFVTLDEKLQNDFISRTEQSL